jgi:hypothetical protein
LISAEASEADFGFLIFGLASEQQLKASIPRFKTDGKR